MIKIPVEPPITEYLHAKAAKMGVPLSGTFELTPVCNMACKMCYVRMTRQQQEAIAPLRSAEQWLALGQQAADAGMLYLLLTGGEPFLHPQFREIFQGLHRQGLILSINSNGTLIDEKTVAWLQETPPVRVNVTLYGASNATYERLCGNPNGFTEATRAIQLLREAGISVKLNCSLTPHNAQDLPGIFDFARENHLLVQGTSYMFPPLRRDETQIGKNERFTAKDAAYYAAQIIRQQNGGEEFIKMLKEKRLPELPQDSNEDCPDLPGEGIRCRAGKCSFWVTWNGTLLPCGMFPSGFGVNLDELGFADAWLRTREQSDAIRLPAKCRDCVARDTCKTCAAMVYTETGGFTKVPQYRCEMMREYPAACRRVEEEIISEQTGDSHD